MVPSPCKGVCKSTDGGICIGCGRDLHEITRWNAMSDQEKQEIIDRLPRRKEKLARLGLLPKKPGTSGGLNCQEI